MDDLKTRPLGSHGPELTLIGLGTWAIGGPGWLGSWGPQDDEASVRTIHQALDEGVNWLDTAPVYGLGHSEEVVGRAISDRRDRVFVATKCVRRFGPDGPFTSGDPAGVRQDCEASLSRLGTDHVDLLQIHHPDPEIPVEDTWGELVKLADEGKTRFIGVSNFDLELHRRCMAVRHVDSTQPAYNLLNRDIESELLPYCQESGIGVIPYGAMAQGMLSGSFDPGRLKGDDWRLRPDVSPRIEAAMAAAEKLRPVAGSRGWTVGQLAIAWVLEHPAVTSAIVGARRPGQVSANVIPASADVSGVRDAVSEALGD